MRGADIHELTRNTNIRSRGVARDDAIFCDVNRFGAEGAIDCAINLSQPGIPPTGKRVEIPLLAVIKFRGDKLTSTGIRRVCWYRLVCLIQKDCQ